MVVALGAAAPVATATMEETTSWLNGRGEETFFSQVTEGGCVITEAHELAVAMSQIESGTGITRTTRLVTTIDVHDAASCLPLRPDDLRRSDA